jgi:hypothetical protein
MFLSFSEKMKKKMQAAKDRFKMKMKLLKARRTGEIPFDEDIDKAKDQFPPDIKELLDIYNSDEAFPKKQKLLQKQLDKLGMTEQKVQELLSTFFSSSAPEKSEEEPNKIEEKLSKQQKKNRKKKALKEKKEDDKIAT